MFKMSVCMKVVSEAGKSGRAETPEVAAARQIEFSLVIPVCAWCHPGEVDADGTQLSHGICLRHFREMMQELKPRPTPAASANARPVRLTQGELISLAS